MHFPHKYRLSSPLLLALLVAAGSAQASSCLSFGGNYNGCNISDFQIVERVVVLDVPLPVQLPTIGYGNVVLLPGAKISVQDRGTISLVHSRMPISWDRFDIGSGGTITFQNPGNDDSLQHIDVSERNRDSIRGWTTADATNFVIDWQSRHRPHDFDEFLRHRHRDDDRGDGRCDDDDLPRPVPLPGAALLFGPALLMLRAVQRRNA